jgi:translation initiation factor IF-3
MKDLRINDQIRVAQVLLIDDAGEKKGIIPIDEALRIAKASGLDLVEVSPNADPPVCKILNYGQLKFKNKKEEKKNTKKRQLKEIKMRPVTDDGDYKVKCKKIKDFLDEGHKVKVTIFYRRAREMSHQDLSAELLSRILVDLAEFGQLEYEPKSEGRQIHMIFSPKKKAS